MEDFYDTYIRPYVTDFTSGYQYGDYEESSLDLPDSGLSSFLYTAGDYVEDIIDAPSVAFDYAKKGIKAWKSGADKLGQLNTFFDDKKPRALPMPGKVSGQATYQTGTFSSAKAPDGRIGQNNAGTQRGMRRMSQNSDLSWVSRILGGQAQLTSRGGRTTIRLNPSSTIAVRSSTKMPRSSTRTT